MKRLDLLIQPPGERDMDQEARPRRRFGGNGLRHAGIDTPRVPEPFYAG